MRQILMRQAVDARWELTDFRPTVDSRGPAIASLFDLAEQRIDVPADQLAFPEHDLSRDQDVANVPGIHHRHNRAGHIVDGPGIHTAGIEHNDVGFLAGSESTNLVEQPSGCRTGYG